MTRAWGKRRPSVSAVETLELGCYRVLFWACLGTVILLQPL